MGDVDDKNLTEEQQRCKRLLMDSAIEKGRHRVFTFAMDTQGPNFLSESLDTVFESLEFAAKLIVALGFVLKNA